MEIQRDEPESHDTAPPGPQRSPDTRAASLPAAPCATCSVRHLCVPRGLDERTMQLLNGLLIGRHRLRKGQRLYRRGEDFHFLYAVRFGSFKASFPQCDGSEHVAGFHLPGDIMGFDGMAHGQHPTTVTALETAEACAIPFAPLMEACASSRELRHRIAQLMGAQLVREYVTSDLIARRRTEERVAGFLLQLAEWMRERGYSPREFQLRMSRADIGSYLGTTVETVSRNLSQFAREGLITVRSRRISLVRAETLRTSYAERRP